MSLPSATSSWKKLSMFKPESTPPTTGHMLKVFAKKSVPMVLANIVDQLIFFTNLVFAGHIGNESMLAALGLGSVFTHMMVLSFLVGLNASQETLTS